MTSLRCFSIKGLRTWFAGADGLFCITPFYSTSRVLSVQGSMFDVQGSRFELGPPTHSLTHPPARSRIGKLGCGFAALCSLRLNHHEPTRQCHRRAFEPAQTAARFAGDS